ncbi:MAG: TPM domain-containing protein [Planctomycetes bacterium]|nr:TPM domain-containing protein [Planctomycetota bacterium]
MSAQLERWLAGSGVAKRLALVCVLLAALSGALSAARVVAQELALPSNEGWVTDRSGVLQPAQERALESQIEAVHQASANEIAVLVLAELGGQPIERVALEAGRRWKVGSSAKNNGVVIVIAVAERKVRIEVGSGLEGELTDAKSGRIIREVLTPRLRDGDYYGGLRDAVTAIEAVLSGDPLPARTGGGAQGAAALGLTLLFLAIVIFLAIVARRGGRGSSALPLILASHMLSRGGGGGGGAFGGFGGFGGGGGGGGFSGGGASGGW